MHVNFDVVAASGVVEAVSYNKIQYQLNSMPRLYIELLITGTNDMESSVIDCIERDTHFLGPTLYNFQ